MTERPTAPGLKWRKRRGGPDVPYWFAEANAVKDGFLPKSYNLSEYVDNFDMLIGKCNGLQTSLVVWKSGLRKPKTGFDGTFKALLELYQTDPQSPLHKHKLGTIKIYTIYLKQLIPDHGNVAIDDTDGRMVEQWFTAWRKKDATPAVGKRKARPARDQLSVALMKLAILKAAVGFGILCRKPGCIEFEAVLGKLEVESLPGRSQAPTAEHIIAARKAAHANGYPGRALLYALQFDTTGRQWDFIGQWLPESDKKLSTVLHRGKKWVGPMWSRIDQHLVLNMTPTKTEDTTAVEVWFDLSVCPMVVEELATIPYEKRLGPLIINERTGLPYTATSIVEGWHKDFKLAKLPPKIWGRDLRAGGISEGSKAGASRDDRKTVAGHASEETTEGYERGLVSLEAHRRTMEKRTQFRSAGNATKT